MDPTGEKMITLKKVQTNVDEKYYAFSRETVYR